MFWIVEKSDSAILGLVRGYKTQRAAAGPFQTYDEAWEEKAGYKRWGCTWYTIVESDTEPENTKESYEFSDAHHEFDDV